MELKVTELQLPGKISFNYAELKTELQTRLSDYANIVYTEDQITAAKKDRADLNRLKKALNDERIRQEKEFMKPFDEFKGQIKELCTLVDKASGAVDTQVKAFEEKQKADKMKEIHDYFITREFPDDVGELNPGLFIEDKWLNASVSMKSIKEAIDAKLEQFNKDLAVIADLPSYGFEARQVYLNTLDLAAAVSEAHRLQEQAEKKAAWEAEQAKRREEAAQANEAFKKQVSDYSEQVSTQPEPETQVRQWIGFQAYLSQDEAKALGAYLRNNGIKYKSI